MKIILLTDVTNLGRRQEVKEVNAGYARNFLLPRGLAAAATAAALKRLELAHRAETERRQRAETERQKTLAALDGAVITMRLSANESGHLFAAVHPADIAAAVKKEKGLVLPEAAIVLTAPLKEIGEYDVPLRWAGGEKEIRLRLKALR